MNILCWTTCNVCVRSNDYDEEEEAWKKYSFILLCEVGGLQIWKSLYVIIYHKKWEDGAIYEDL